MVGSMSGNTFSLDITAAGQEILQGMAQEIVEQSGAAILSRANAMASSLSAEPPGFDIASRIGVIKTGQRAITTITVSDTADAHQAYIGYMALVKALDAGRV